MNVMGKKEKMEMGKRKCYIDTLEANEEMSN